MIHARTVLLELQGKLGMYKLSHGHGKFEYFMNLAILDRQAQNTVYGNYLLIYISHLEISEEERNSRFCDLQGMVDPDYVISLFQCAIELTYPEPNLGEQLLELRMDLEAKSLFT